MDYQSYLAAFGGGIVGGYLLFLFILWLLPRRLTADQERQRKEILADAKAQADATLKSYRENSEDKLQLLKEDLDDELHERREAIKIAEEDLESQHSSLQREQSRVEKLEKTLQDKKNRVETVAANYKEKQAGIDEVYGNLRVKLEEKSGLQATAVAKNLVDSAIERKQLEAQKSLKFLDEELSSNARRRASRLISRAMARYAPEFYWPKMTNSIELAEASLLDELNTSEGEQLLATMKEFAGCEVELIHGPEVMTPFVKLAGGLGVARESARLALNDIIIKRKGGFADAQKFYDRRRELLEQEAVRLGRDAIHIVGLEDIHPEIQKLVGYLNWRTSYRQNQWHHTVEVAILAGIVGAELGVDPDEAKRVGLLHDIGKALDYNIDGSHAVISGDYADRFGENRMICDTVMSHHNDLIVETPLSFVLKTADTLSGARPGARVNLEEGYQMRLSGIDNAVRSFPGIVSVSIMNGAREVHVEVNHKKVTDEDLNSLSTKIARKIEEDVAFPGEIKILVTRRFEATAVA